jgi:hypothetical protein
LLITVKKPNLRTTPKPSESATSSELRSRTVILSTNRMFQKGSFSYPRDCSYYVATLSGDGETQQQLQRAAIFFGRCIVCLPAGNCSRNGAMKLPLDFKMAEAARASGDYETARVWYDAALVVAKENRDRTGEVLCFWGLAE